MMNSTFTLTALLVCAAYTAFFYVSHDVSARSYCVICGLVSNKSLLLLYTHTRTHARICFVLHALLMYIFENAFDTALGSPIGLYLSVRGTEHLGAGFRLRACTSVINVLHKGDPLALRLEPLLSMCRILGLMQ